MEKYVSPLTRQFSSIEGLQTPYTLVYSLDEDGTEGCRLTLCRTGKNARAESVWLEAAPETGYRLLQFMSENAVQPEAFRDLLADLYPLAQPGGKGGVVREV